MIEAEQQAIDLDWFFTDGRFIGFVASAGGKLPDSVARFPENSNKLEIYFRGLSEISSVIVRSKKDRKYLKDFTYMSARGLFAFDKTVLNNFSESNYHLVSKPLNPLTIDKVSEEIKGLLILTKTNYNVDNIDFDVKSII
jgi:hypothetical protein